jgi:hypothetical protein
VWALLKNVQMLAIQIYKPGYIPIAAHKSLFYSAFKGVHYARIEWVIQINERSILWQLFYGITRYDLHVIETAQAMACFVRNVFI